MPMQARLDAPGILHHVEVVRYIHDALTEVGRELSVSVSAVSRILTQRDS